jgi:signal transduction histidine kinase/CheY-like chemotaxis protein
LVRAGGAGAKERSVLGPTGRRRTSIGLAGAALAVLAGLLVAGLWKLHEAELADGLARSREIAHGGERFVAGVVDKVDLALLDLAQRYQESPANSPAGKAALQERLTERHALLDLPLSLALFDAQGAQKMDAGGEPKPLSVADREYFHTHGANSAAGLTIEGPVLARNGAKTIVIMARRLSGPQGQFEGVVVACVPVEFFERGFAPSMRGARSSIWLLRMDSTVVARAPALPSLSGRRLYDPAVFTRQVSSERAGTMEMPSPVDGRLKLVSYQRVHKYPLVLAAVLDREEMLGGWTRAARLAGGAALAAILLAAALLVLAWRRAGREADTFARLRTRNVELERAIDERARVSREASARAEDAAAAQLRLFASLGHALRAPLSQVGGTCAVLADTALDARQRACVQTIDASSRTLARLTDDLLDMARCESGTLQLESAPVALWWLFDDLVAEFEARCAAKGVLPAVEIDPELPPAALADAARLRQVFSRLLDNAVDATPRGSVALRVRVTGSDPQKVGLRVEVRDSGPGFAPAETIGLFDGFRPDRHGSIPERAGLGLALCRRLVELHGGRIGVASRLGAGATVWIELMLPAARCTDCAQCAPVAPLAGRGGLLLTGGGARGATLERWLHAAAMRVWTVASSGALFDALELSGTDPYDVVVLDRWHAGVENVAMPLLQRVPAGAAPAVLLLDDGAQTGATLPARAARLPSDADRTTFHAALCRLVRCGPPTLEPRPQADPDAPVPARPVRILLAEDNVINTTFTVALLRMYGYEVDHAEDGDRALALARERPYDVLLFDAYMPVLDGAGALAAIRADPQAQRLNGATPAIVVTADAMQGARGRLLSQGFDDYLSKPFLAEDLKALIDRWCSGRSTSSQAAT